MQPDPKPALRAQAQTRRNTQNPAKGHHLTAHLLASLPPRPNTKIAAYWPMQGEIDIRPLLLALLARGHQILLPEAPLKGHPLIFRQWRPNTPMLVGRHNTRHPDTQSATPGLLLVPLLAFDRHCNRLGYGGGYYDRTIQSLPGIPTIGCAFAAQQVDAVPVLPHDAPLDAIATEHGILHREH